MRPIVLVVDPPDPETLSTRKLVLESAKFNVLTGDSMNEAYEILEACPVAAAIFQELALGGANPSEIIGKLKKKVPETPVIVRYLQTMLHVPHDPAAVVSRVQRQENKI